MNWSEFRETRRAIKIADFLGTDPNVIHREISVLDCKLPILVKVLERIDEGRTVCDLAVQIPSDTMYALLYRTWRRDELDPTWK